MSYTVVVVAGTMTNHMKDMVGTISLRDKKNYLP